MPHLVTDRENKRFAYVLPKFILGDSEKLVFELKELKGSRKVTVETRL